MTTYALPTVTGLATFNLTPQTRVATSQSPFSYKRQVLTYPGQRWAVSASIPMLNRDSADIWRAFFTRLNGGEHTFLLGDPLSSTAKGEAGGTPLINGTLAVGASIVTIDGATTSQSNWLMAGDYIQIGTGENARLYMVVSNVSTNGSGEASVSIWPNLQIAPSDNDAVIVSNPQGCFFLEGAPTFETDDNSFTRVSFTAASVV